MEKQIMVTVPYDKFKAMEFELNAIKEKRIYIVRNLFEAEDSSNFVIGGIHPDFAKIIEEANDKINQNESLRKTIEYQERELNMSTIKISRLTSELEKLSKSKKWF